MSFFKWKVVRLPRRAGGVAMTGFVLFRWVGGGAAMATVDQSSMRGLVAAGALFVAAFL
jgi:hypothetical protein